MILFLVFTFLIGLIIGSFLNVVVIRGARGEKLGGRSACISCRTTLSPRELIPLLSFVIQKRRCRHCGAVFSWQYPIVEFASAIAFTSSFWIVQGYFSEITLSFILTIVAVWIGVSAALVIFVSDLRYTIIPDGAVILLFLLGIARIIAFPSRTNADIIGTLALTLIFYLLWHVSKGSWMGFGDVKLVATTSLLLGFPASLSAFLFSFWSGGLVGIILLLARQKEWGGRIPFGPFILLGALLAYFYSPIFMTSSGLDQFIFTSF